MDLKNMSAGTIARTLILILALVNQVLSATGRAVLPIEDAQIESLVSAIWTMTAALVAWWKNNSVTTAAINADKVLKDIAEGREVGGSKGVIVDESQKGEIE